MKNYWLDKLKEKEKEESEDSDWRRVNALWHSVYKKKSKASKGLWLPNNIGNDKK